MQYFADAIVDKCIRWGQSPLLVGVLESPKDHIPIGIAREIGSGETNTPVWSITIRGVTMPGRFVIIDGEFMQIEARTG